MPRVLVVGEGGSGKTELLEAICGNADMSSSWRSSTTGLGVAVWRTEQEVTEFLEVGAGLDQDLALDCALEKSVEGVLHVYDASFGLRAALKNIKEWSTKLADHLGRRNGRHTGPLGLAVPSITVGCKADLPNAAPASFIPGPSLLSGRNSSPRSGLASFIASLPVVSP